MGSEDSARGPGLPRGGLTEQGKADLAGFFLNSLLTQGRFEDVDYILSELSPDAELPVVTILATTRPAAPHLKNRAAFLTRALPWLEPGILPYLT